MAAQSHLGDGRIDVGRKHAEEKERQRPTDDGLTMHQQEPNEQQLDKACDVDEQKRFGKEGRDHGRQSLGTGEMRHARQNEHARQRDTPSQGNTDAVAKEENNKREN